MLLLNPAPSSRDDIALVEQDRHAEQQVRAQEKRQQQALRRAERAERVRACCSKGSARQRAVFIAFAVLVVYVSRRASKAASS